MSIINKKNNVSGNWSHKLGKKYNIAMGKTKEFITKKQIKHGAQFQKYAGPTVKLGRTVGAGVMGAGKFALRAGALGIPGAVATGLYYGGKKLGKTITGRQRGLEWASYRQYNKKGRKIR